MFGKRKKKRDEIKKNLREKLDYKMKSENVAIPEIHTKDFDEIEEQIDEQEVEKEEAYILYFLHQQDCYKVGIKENDFEHRFEMWCQGRQLEYPGKISCEKAIKHLYKNKMIDIEAEMIYLREQVIGHVTS